MRQLERNVIQSFNLAKRDIIKLQQDIVTIVENQQRLMSALEDMRLRHERLADEIKEHKPSEKVTIIKEAPKEESIKVIKVAAPKTVTKTIVKVQRARKQFVASKTGKKFHMPSCVFTKNIKPKMILKFKTKKSAMNKGFRPCDCVKK